MRILRLALFLLGAFPLFAQSSSDPVSVVDTSIGTIGDGQTFPATGVPFAMTHWTPQTRAGEAKCKAPYYYDDPRIQGFRGSHFLSGSCTQDYGSVTVMPLAGELKITETERASLFRHDSETFAPHRYAVTLEDYGIRAEITGTSRAGMMRFTYSTPKQAWILVQSNSRRGEGSIHIDEGKREITGFNPAHRVYAGQGKFAGFNGYFVVQFDHSFQTHGTWTGEKKQDGSLQQEGEEGAPGAYVSFKIKGNEAVQVRIGTSFTSVEEARRNLSSEIPSWSFSEVEGSAKEAWEQALHKIDISGTEEQQTIFYTALYHSFLLPRTVSDVSGTYPTFASNGKIGKAEGFTYYCDFSIWDTFRALHPLLTLLDPQRESEMVRSLILKGEQGGFLPIFPAWNNYTQEMIGDHAISIIGDAFLKGLKGFDIDAAYALMKKNATELPSSEEDYKDGRGRRGLRSYLQYGYVPLEDPVPDAYHQKEQVSRTLEYAYDDSVLGKVAEALGKKDDASLFLKRAQNYRNVIDPKTGFARGRHADGSWDAPFDPAGNYSYITEGLPYQYTFFVPQDLPGLIQLVGGREAFIQKLDGLFAGNYYNHGNEPSHHIAYLYDYAGAAWKTQEKVHEIEVKQYRRQAAGVAGNDDCGQMSAWFIMSALGFYSVTPGVPEYAIGSPLYDHASIHFPGGKTLHIQATGASKGKYYIQSLRLNGKRLERPWIRHSELIAGGELVFELGDTPNKNWPKQ